MTNYGEVGAIVGQRTIGGALVSQAVIYEGISVNFPPGGTDQLTYGLMPLAPYIYLNPLTNKDYVSQVPNFVPG